MNPVALPPGFARLATKPAPTGSTVITNTIGTVRVACSQRRHGCGATRGHQDVRRERDQFGDVSAKNVLGRGPAGVDPQVAAVAPAQLLQGPRERREAGLSFRIARGLIYEHANTPHALCLLRARRRGPFAAAPPSSVMNSRRLMPKVPPGQRPTSQYAKR